jgi:hypothetical protein
MTAVLSIVIPYPARESVNQPDVPGLSAELGREMADAERRLMAVK